jgi:hypothetical protein
MRLSVACQSRHHHGPTEDAQALSARALGLKDSQARLCARQAFLFFDFKPRDLEREARYKPMLLPPLLFSARDTRASLGVIWPETGFASNV